MKAKVDWHRRYYQKLLNTFLASYYSSLDTMPIASFFRCMSGDIKYVSKNKYLLPKKAIQKWETLFNQYIKLHGLPESYLIYMDKMKKAISLYAEVCKGQKWKIVLARVKEKEAINMIQQEGESVEITCARISKHMGFAVRANECSVTEFYSYVHIISGS